MEVVDPFDMEGTISVILKMVRMGRGVKALILKRECALVSGRRQKRLYRITLDQERCLGKVVKEITLKKVPLA